MGTFGEKNLHIYNISLLHKMYEPKSNATIIRKFTERKQLVITLVTKEGNSILTVLFK